MPEVASRHHLELVNPVVDAALGGGRASGSSDVDALAVTRGPGLIGALLVGVSTAKGLAAAARKPLRGVDHLHGHVAANFLEPDPLEPPFLCLIASGGHTLLAGVRAHERLRGPRPDARRRRRRGARQGGAAARARLPGRPGDRARGARRRPGGVRVPGRDARRPAPRLQLQRPEDGAALRGPRPRRRRRRGAPRRPRRELPGRGRRPAGGEAAPRCPRRQPAASQRRRRLGRGRARRRRRRQLAAARARRGALRGARAWG